jgi:septin family protein
LDAGLDEPFLLVVVGEFNSGKSSVINALLGSAVLEEGILPTTNEISVLKYTSKEAALRQVLPSCSLHAEMRHLAHCCSGLAKKWAV